jgi:nucleotide-binding universal stress UspA family protein
VEKVVMLKSIFVPMNGSSQDGPALETALSAARLFESHLECARVRMTSDYLVWEGSLMDVVGGVMEGDLISHLDKQDRERTTKALHTFKEFCEREKIAVADGPSGRVGVTARWQELRGHQVGEFVKEARFHDLIVVARNLLTETDPAVDFIGHMLLGSGRPILLASETPPKSIGKTVVVAWKNTPEAARAVSAAMPILAQAEAVVVISALEDELPEEKGATAHKLAETLRWNGCNASSQPVEPEGRIAAAVLSRAEALGADLLVMGGYGHSRLRQTVLGGFTRDILEGASLPVLLFH